MGFTWRKSSWSHKQKAKFPCSSASQVSISIPFGYIHWPKQHHGQAYGQAPESDLGLRWECLNMVVCASRLTFGTVTISPLPCMIKLSMYSLQP